MAVISVTWEVIGVRRELKDALRFKESRVLLTILGIVLAIIGIIKKDVIFAAIQPN